jgi:glucose-6-phosphate-specific signal transduction histidine kinase
MKGILRAILFILCSGISIFIIIFLMEELSKYFLFLVLPVSIFLTWLYAWVWGLE